MQRKLVKYLGDLKEQGAPMTKKETIEASINVKSVQFVVFWYHGANCIGLIEQIIVFRVNQISQASVVRNRRIETMVLVFFLTAINALISATKRVTMRQLVL